MPKKLHNALSPLAVKSLGPGRHADGGGLYLRVQGQGARSWLFRAMIDGKTKDIGLGPASGPKALTLAEARTKARDLAALYAKGETVEGERSRKRREATEARLAAMKARPFREYAEGYIARKESGWSNPKHRQQWRNTLATYAYPMIGDLPLAEIETAHVMAVLEPIWTAKPETADRVRGRIELILSAAKVEGLRSGENPAAWRGHLENLLARPDKLSRGHHPALAYAELPAFMEALRSREALTARALEFAILTACRSGEMIGAKWAEVDISKKIWAIPADRMKAGKAHEIPLSDRALAILADVAPLNTRDNPVAPLFPAHDGKPLSVNALRALLQRMHGVEVAEGRPGWIDRKQGDAMITAHGFRSTFRDWAGEQTAFPREVIEHALAHQLPDKSEASYARATLLPKRVKLMEAWANYAAAPLAAGAVIPIGKRASEGNGAQ